MLSRRLVAPLLALAAFVAPAVTVAPAADAIGVPAMAVSVPDANNTSYAQVVTASPAGLTIVNLSGYPDATYTAVQGSVAVAATRVPGTPVWTLTPPSTGTSSLGFTVIRRATGTADFTLVHNLIVL